MNSQAYDLDRLVDNALTRRLTRCTGEGRAISAERIDRILAAACRDESKVIPFPDQPLSDRASELMAARNGKGRINDDLIDELDRLMEEDDDEG